MSKPVPEQPRYFTVFDLLFEMVMVGMICGGFYVGYRYGGVGVGLIGGVLARGGCLVIGLLAYDWANRRNTRPEQP